MTRIRVRIAPAALLLALAASSLSAEVVILQAAASLRGLNPFFSDVRAFNTSYSASLEVNATFRCFVGPCPTATSDPSIHFVLAPRESRAFDDIVANAGAFNAHDTGGGIEFEYSGSPGQLVVTSRLYSNEPLNSVGMFIPALPASRAYANSILTSIRHDAPNSLVAGFRTNVGLFNLGDSSAVATLLTFDFDGEAIGSPLTRTVPPHSGLQISGVFEAAGASEVTTSNATIVVNASAPIFTYAAVIDGRTADPIFVVGANNDSGTPSTDATLTPTPSGGPDQTPTKTKTPMGGPSPTRTPTRTPTAPGPTMTPTPPGPSATPTPTVPGPSVTPTATAATTSTPTFTITVPPTITRTPTPTPIPNQVNVGPGMTFSPVNITINAGQTVTWVWVGSGHSTTSDTGLWDSGVQIAGFMFAHTFPSAGSFPYHCVIHGAPGGVGMSGTVTVVP